MIKKNYDLLEKLEVKIEKGELKFQFDCRGHYKFEDYYIASELQFSLFHCSNKQLELIEAEKKFPTPIEISLMGLGKCPYCGEHFKYMFDGKMFTAKTSCAYSDGIKNVSLELNIPSGKIVFANDLRKWFKNHANFNVNTDVGIVSTIKSYEKFGMAHGFVGNTCPTIYQINKRSLTISDPPDEDYWDSESSKLLPLSKDVIKKTTPAGKRVGGICTDLWWYSVVDYNDFKSRFLDMGGSLKDFNTYIENNCNVVKIYPGVYSVTHYFTNYKEEKNEPKHYATFSWDRKPEKNSLYENYKNINYTIGQCWLAAIAAYPTVYGFNEEDLPKKLSMEERIEKLKTFPTEVIRASKYRFYNYIFCGNHADWHINGWGSSNEIPDGTPNFELPLLDGKYTWSTMSRDYCSLFFAANKKIRFKEQSITFNESFLAAAYEVIYSILKYGVEPYSNDSLESKDKYIKDQAIIALECLESLNKLYPGSIPESCKEFL